MRDTSLVTTLVSFSILAAPTRGRLVMTTAVSNDSFRGGYCGSGVRGASEKYPSRLAASAARASASSEEMIKRTNILEMGI